MSGEKQPDRAELLRRAQVLLGSEAIGLKPLIDRDPGFVAAFADMAEAVWNGPHLGPKEKHLICLAVNASVTHLHAPGVARHVEGALAAGASEHEILSTLEMIAVLGVHSVTTGFPILVDEMRRRGQSLDSGPMTAEQEEAKQVFTAARGWNPRFEPVARLTPAYLRNYAIMSAHPAKAGVLPAKTREFIYIAIDAAVTHIFEPGLRAHIATALDLGATTEEIAELLALVSLIGIEGCILGLANLPSSRSGDGGGRSNA